MTGSWVRNPRVLWRRVAGGVLLLAPDSGEPLLMTGSGAAAWELLAAPLDGDELARRLAETFGVTAEETGAATAPFLADLAERGILSRTA